MSSRHQTLHQGNSMKSYRKELWFNIPSRRGFVNITRQVEEALHESGIGEGLILVNAMHITASVFINDDESGLHQDYEKWLDDVTCPNCGASMDLDHEEDLVKNLYELAEASGARVEIIGEDSDEGKLLKKAFSGLAGILRYAPQRTAS